MAEPEIRPVAQVDPSIGLWMSSANRRRLADNNLEDALGTSGGLPWVIPASSSTRIILGEVRRHKLAVALTLTLLLAGIALGYYAFFVRGGDDPIQSLAVLPFTNVSADPDTEYLSDGLTESIIFNLSRLTRLKVLPRSSVGRYKGKDKDPRTIGTELGARAVLAGRILLRGGDLSVSAELIEVSENRVLWGQQ